MSHFNVPLIIRGIVIDDGDVTHGGRGGDVNFVAPDVGRHVTRLVLQSPAALADLYALSMEDILDYLDGLAQRLAIDQNRWVQEAFELSCRTSGLGPEILRALYQTQGSLLSRETMREAAEQAIGIEYLEGWVESRLESGIRAKVRAFGARSVHIIAGNAPGIAAMTIGRNAVTRGDAIIKTPSNDPLTAVAIARTMIEMAPDHAITRHLSVGYWKGGDITVEEKLYDPAAIEKIVAWGGTASIKHISRYVQPGIELVTLDPKLSSTIIGAEAFADDPTLRYVASALALDVGALNQEGCVNARVVYVQSGTGAEGLERLSRLGGLVWEALQALPASLSGPAVHLDSALQEEIDALKYGGDEWYEVIGGGVAGAVIISQMDEAVDFARILANRVVNLVPVDDLDIPINSVTNYTQTIGIYPESLKLRLRDRLAIHGAQRLVTLGHAIGMGNHGLQDGIEPMRRMCRWIVDEEAA